MLFEHDIYCQHSLLCKNIALNMLTVEQYFLDFNYFYAYPHYSGRQNNTKMVWR